MLPKAYLSAALLACIPAFSQAISPLNSVPSPDGDQMAMPPPISGHAYPLEVGAEQLSNYLRGGMTFETFYVDNMYPGFGRPIAETVYSILPTLNLDQTTLRRHATVSYSPGFTFYQPTTQLNEVDQNATLAYRVRVSPHSAIYVNDQFIYSSTAFSPVASEFGGTVSGTVPTLTPGIIAPFAQRLTNDAEGGFSLQTGRRSMLGASGTASRLHYPNLSEVPGLYDFSSLGGSGFYNRRISERSYTGATYAYTKILAYLPHGQGETDLQSVAPFFTVYPREGLSLSVSSGPEYYRLSETGQATTSSWAPAISTSIGWQRQHTNFAASYSQSVTGGGGFLGAFHSRVANGTARWQISRSWIFSAGAGYAINKTASLFISSGLLNGHSVSGSATVTHSISRRLSMNFEYDRLHQSYDGIQAISTDPDSNRAAASLSWQFMRPLGQ
jgi:hypothetical protein